MLVSYEHFPGRAADRVVGVPSQGCIRVVSAELYAKHVTLKNGTARRPKPHLLIQHVRAADAAFLNGYNLESTSTNKEKS